MNGSRMGTFRPNPFPPLVIRASAGTGKTHQLTSRYLALLAAGVPADRILATTFTRKAAGEILARVLQRLADAARDARKRGELAEAIGDPSLTADRCHDLLESLVRQLHRVRVCTLDAFFAQIAGSFAMEIGLPMAWRIADPVEEASIASRALGEILSREGVLEVTHLIHLMTQGESVRSVNDLLQGTVDRLYGVFRETDESAWSRFPASQLLGERERAELVDELARVAIPTHATIVVARTKCVELARNGDWDGFLEAGMMQRIAEGRADYCGKVLSDACIDVCRRLIRHAAGIAVEKLRNQTQATHALLSRFDDRMRELKRETRGLRFDDITRALARAVPLLDVAQIEFRLDAPIRHLLLDEFQDTSSMQWRALEPFARRILDERASRPPSSSETPHKPADVAADAIRSFFCVGDGKQAIYGWRGGQAAILDAITHRLPGLETTSLAHSYRSSPVVIDAVNRVFTRIADHPRLERLEGAVRDWCARFERHTTHRTELPGHVTLETFADAGGEENAAADADEYGERGASGAAAYAAQRVERIASEAPDRTIGILMRDNDGVAEMMFELRKLHVSASEEGGNPLTDSAPVTAILALLHLADHPGDTTARYHIAHSPVGELFERLDWSDANSMESFAADLRERLVRDGYGPTIREWVERVETDATSRDRGRLRQLIEFAYPFDTQATLRPSDFVRLVEKNRAPDPSGERIRVMTIHQAKGLEFDIVVLPQLDARLVGQPPSHVVDQPDPTEAIQRVCRYRNQKTRATLPADIQEMFDRHERRTVTESLCVLYVALTRAVHALHMVIGPSSKRERGLPKTMAGLLRAALTDGRPLSGESVVFESGDSRWWTSGTEPRAGGRRARPLPVIRFAKTAPQPLRLTAPSALEGGDRVRANQMLSAASTPAMVLGTAFHSLFECVTWIENGMPDAAMLRAALRRGGVALDSIDAILDEFREMIAKPRIADLFRRADYEARYPSASLSVANERRIVTIFDDRLLTGAIDRLVLVRENGRVTAAEIIDFKTDQVRGNDETPLAERVLHYGPQQSAYRSAVAKIYRLETDRVAARLAFVRSGMVVDAV